MGQVKKRAPGRTLRKDGENKDMWDGKDKQNKKNRNERGFPSDRRRRKTSDDVCMTVSWASKRREGQGQGAKPSR
eukprot:758699-Hanusia_phi.AAC.5